MYTLNSREFEKRIRKKTSRPSLFKGVTKGVSHDVIQMASRITIRSSDFSFLDK